jgi:hypothetical protein
LQVQRVLKIGLDVEEIVGLFFLGFALGLFLGFGLDINGDWLRKDILLLRSLDYCNTTLHLYRPQAAVPNLKIKMD